MCIEAWNIINVRTGLDLTSRARDLSFLKLQHVPS